MHYFLRDPLESRTSCVPPVLVEHDVTVGRPAILLQFGTIEPKAILDPHAGLGETNDPVAVDPDQESWTGSWMTE